MLEAEIHGAGVGDEEIVPSDDSDEVAGDVAASDALAVDDVIREADMSIRLDPLPANQANLGHVSIAKVSLLSLVAYFSAVTPLDLLASNSGQQNRQQRHDQGRSREVLSRGQDRTETNGS
jgi:hypothetical protein